MNPGFFGSFTENNNNKNKQTKKITNFEFFFLPFAKISPKVINLKYSRKIQLCRRINTQKYLRDDKDKAQIIFRANILL